MDWNELRKRHPYLPETSDGYHQHANGGGWVIDTVTVSDDTMVGERALVLGGTIRGGTIGGGTIWGGTIRGGTIWGGTIWGGTIRGGTIDHTPLLIFGTQYWIGYAGDNLVASGCITKPLPWWLENIERCAEEYGYNEQQQKEYRMHIEHMAAWMRLYGYAEEPTDAAGQDSQPEEPQGAE